MNVVLTVIFVLEIAIAFTRTEAKPYWSWDVKNNHKQWNHPEKYHSCSIGKCIEAWNCEKTAIVESEEDSCKYNENGPWVCCLVNDDGFHYWENTNAYTDSPKVFKQVTALNSHKVSSTPSTDKYYNDRTHNPVPKDTLNGNENPELPHISGLGGVLKNDREKFPVYKPRDKTPVTKVPNISVTNVITKSYYESTPSNKYNKTTNLWDNSRTSTSNPIYNKRTSSFDKPLTSTSNPNYNKRTNSFGKPLTSTSNPDYNRRTSSYGKPLTSTSNPGYNKRTNSSGKPLTSTSNPGYNKRTSSSDKPRTSASNPTYIKRTTHSWEKHRTSDSGTVTKFIASSPSTKMISNNISTKKSWTQLSASKSPWEYTTPYSKRTVSTTTHYPYFRKTTLSNTASTERRNQIWGSSTTTYDARSQTLKPKTTRFSSTRSTAKSTRQSTITTPLPNVNIYLCGIRDEQTIVRREERDGNYEHNPIGGAVYSGRTLSRNKVPYQRIVGGEEVEPFSWPWVAALYKVSSSGGNRFLSAGSLINENFILTAAHVFTPDDLRTASYVAMLGTHDAQDAVAQYIVSSVMLHPKYEHRYYYNDIALLKLERKVTFSNYIMPICLPSSTAPLLSDRDLLGKNVTVMGWGDDSFGGKSSQVLKKATFPIVSRVSCNASYVRVASNRFPKGITADMLCAGDPRGGKDACQGDSGGPLAVTVNRRYTQVGIVSFGYQCGDKEFPGVYTKVAPYLNWIAENTKSVDSSADHDYY